MNLSPEEKEVGKQNFAEAVGTTRRTFLKESIAATVAAGSVGVLGASYFHYSTIENPLRVGIIGTGDEGGVLIGALNPDYIQVQAIADIRPYSVHRAFHGDWYSPGARSARPGLMQVYGWTSEDQAKDNVKVYTDYIEMLDDQDLGLEAVIIAVPLHLHDAAAIEAMKRGYHVLTEKLMAHSVKQCKEMARVAQSTDRVLATGHQRHYSILYDNAVDQIRQGLIGDVHYIRAQWHRGNMPGHDSWRPALPCQMMSEDEYVAELRKQRAQGNEKQFREEYELLGELFSWESVLNGTHPKVPQPKGKAIDEWEKKISQKKAQINDFVKAENYGYQEGTLPGGYHYSPLEELVRWRLWNRTGGGLMVELGSHQLDAASIFISANLPKGQKARPLSVDSVGGRQIFPENREVDDHVYAIFEFPGEGYYTDYETREVADPNKKICVTYSSINGNGFGGWGEVVFGTKGTLILEREQEAMLFKGSSTTTRIEVRESDKGPVMDTYETGGGGAAVAQAAIPTELSRGYREEIEHWAWCIKNRDPENQPHCPPKVALADAVIALATNVAKAENRRIEFQDAWFKIDDDAVPESGSPKPRKASELV